MNDSVLLRRCIALALVLAFAASMFGFALSAANDNASRLERREDYASEFAYVAANPGSMPPQLEARLHQVWRSNRAVDTHTHAANVALVLLLLSVFSAVFTPARRWPLAGLACGTLIYPAGLLIQFFDAEFAGQVVAAIGGSLIVVCGAVIALGIIGAFRHD